MKRLLIATLALATPVAASANGMLQWQNNSASYLYGTNYDLAPSETQQTVTLEHASGWSVGDLFAFVDGTKYNGAGETGFYAEISPRFSLGKITGKDFSYGIVKDVLVATTFEFGDEAPDTLLVGAGVDLALPGFDFFQLNAYQRLPESGVKADTIQITNAWKATFPVANSFIVFDGFIDWVITSDDDMEANLHICPQIKYDLGANLGLGKSKLYTGVELDYWQNKYGTDVDQSTGSLIVKYHF